jgi:hypothetical protein
MRWAKRISGVVWILSWSVLYREIFHWHHVTRTLRFDPPPPPPGTDIEPHPGLPLLAVLAGSAIAPPAFVTLVAVDRARRRRGRPAT